MPDRLLTTAEVAKLLHVAPQTVIRWADAGRIDIAQKLPGLRGGYLFAPDAVERLAEDRPADPRLAG